MTTPEAAAMLQEAIAAHGGSVAWDGIEALEADISLSGTLLAVKWRRGLDHVLVRVYTRQPRLLVYDFPGPGLTAELAGEREARIVDGAGNVMATRPTPRRAFDHPRRLLYWDDLDFIYFVGVTLWNTLTMPFLFALEGFSVGKLDPAPGHAGTWSRLEARFPSRLPAHSRSQIVTLDEERLVRQVDQVLEPAAKWLRAVQFLEDYTTFAGLRFATRQRLMPFVAGKEPQGRPVLMALQLHHVRRAVG